MPSSASTDRATTHTKKLVLKELTSRGTGTYTGAGTDRIRSAHSHDFIGFDSFSYRFDPATGVITVWGAFAVDGGTIYGRTDIQSSSPDFTGRITGGAGAYRGGTGTIDGHSGRHHKTFMTFHYEL